MIRNDLFSYLTWHWFVGRLTEPLFLSSRDCDHKAVGPTGLKNMRGLNSIFGSIWFLNLVFWWPLDGIWAWPPVLDSSQLFNIPSNPLFFFLSDFSSRLWIISQCQRKNPKWYSIHCNIFTWRRNAPFLLSYTVIDKYPFISYPSKPTFEGLGNTQHKPVWQRFSNSCGSEHPEKLSADLYAAQLDIWVCPATLSCHWMKTWGLPYSLAPSPFKPSDNGISH